MLRRPPRGKPRGLAAHPCLLSAPWSRSAGSLRDRSEGRERWPPIGCPCRLRRPREPGDPGPAAGPGGRGWQERGARSGGWGEPFPVAGSAPGLGGLRGPGRGSRSSRGIRGDGSSASEGGVPRRWVPGSCRHRPLTLPPPVLGGPLGRPPGVLLPFTPFPLKSTWLGC